MDSEPTLKVKPSSWVGRTAVLPYLRRANNGAGIWHYLNIKALNRYNYVNVSRYCSKIYSLPVF